MLLKSGGFQRFVNRHWLKNGFWLVFWCKSFFSKTTFYILELSPRLIFTIKLNLFLLQLMSLQFRGKILGGKSTSLIFYPFLVGKISCKYLHFLKMLYKSHFFSKFTKQSEKQTLRIHYWWLYLSDLFLLIWNLLY